MAKVGIVMGSDSDLSLIHIFAGLIIAGEVVKDLIKDVR